ncbi:MAG: glycolate oxidase subunit GlcF [Pseudomonadota bacterium]
MVESLPGCLFFVTPVHSWMFCPSWAGLMQTRFTKSQLANPDNQMAEAILRKCVHCGMCTAFCPTYVNLGDELDSPRGRIYLIKDLLEEDRAVHQSFVTHIDRCLSCLSCMSACPAGVDYRRLVDLARIRIRREWKRPLADRLQRKLVGQILSNPATFRLALIGAKLIRPFRNLLPKWIRHQIDYAPTELAPPSRSDQPHIMPAQGVKRARIALLAGCVQPVLAPDINRAARDLLAKMGCEIVIAKGVGCCGALAHHAGDLEQARTQARKVIDGWMREIEGDGLDAIVMTASGCGSVIGDYAHLFKDDPEWHARAEIIEAKMIDFSAFLDRWPHDWPPAVANKSDGLAVALHVPCSLQHGQGLADTPKRLLDRHGFKVLIPDDAHLCCGSAGTYSLFQPELSGKLRADKLDQLTRLQPDLVATANIGCLHQLNAADAPPIVHLAELLAWRYLDHQPDRFPQ